MKRLLAATVVAFVTYGHPSEPAAHEMVTTHVPVAIVYLHLPLECPVDRWFGQRSRHWPPDYCPIEEVLHNYLPAGGE